MIDVKAFFKQLFCRCRPSRCTKIEISKCMLLSLIQKPLSFRTASLNRCNLFNNMMQVCGLGDLGFQGPAYTWCNKRHGLARIQVRLDRALASWRTLFPDAMVKHLPRLHSDHCPILLQCEEVRFVQRSRRPFRFQAMMWMTHADCKDIVEEVWRETVGSVIEKTGALTTALKSWNKDIFGDLFARKRALKGRILGLRKVLGDAKNENV